MKKNNNIVTSTLNKVFNAKIFSNKIFNNQITLFIVSAIAFISLYRYIIMYEFSAVLLFFIIAGLAYSFTKNMTIVLGSAFLATLIVSMFKGLFGFKEGMEVATPTAEAKPQPEDLAKRSKGPPKDTRQKIKTIVKNDNENNKRYGSH